MNDAFPYFYFSDVMQTLSGLAPSFLTAGRNAKTDFPEDYKAYFEDDVDVPQLHRHLRNNKFQRDTIEGLVAGPCSNLTKCRTSARWPLLMEPAVSSSHACWRKDGQSPLQKKCHGIIGLSLIMLFNNTINRYFIIFLYLYIHIFMLSLYSGRPRAILPSQSRFARTSHSLG